jgi:hypothetical protein
LGSEVRGNRVRGLSPEPGSLAVGIITFGGQISIVDNRVIGSGQNITAGIGILSSGANLSFCRDNLIANFETGMTVCEDNGGNVVHGEP